MAVVYAIQPYPLEPLAAVSALEGFNGGPFVQNVVSSAGDSIRDECGWHVAPVLTMTAKVRGAGTVILLPTLKLSDVQSVVDRDGNQITGFDWFENGVIERRGGFPDYVEVLFVHGYHSCPPSLLAVVAERAAARSGGRIKSEALAGRSVSLEGGYDPVASRVVARYTLNGRL